jgi:phosphoglycerate dehydrogenase-like enzyme
MSHVVAASCATGHQGLTIILRGARLKILLLDMLLPEALAWLRERHDVECHPGLAQDPRGLEHQIAHADAVVLPRKVAVTQSLLQCAPRLRAVARLHVGTDDTDLEACREHGVRVLQATTANVRSNAEFLLAGIFSLLRRGVSGVLQGQRHEPPRLGRELYGSTVGILGLAPTAHTLAPMLHALGVNLVGYDPAIHHSAPLWKSLHIQPLPLPEVLRQADAISVQAMYATRFCGFINDQVLAHCKPGQIWVGITRSAFFEPEALARALSDGRMDACLLDGAGFASAGSPLHDCTNLYLTPRLGSHTQQARMRASWYVAHRLHAVLSQTNGEAAEVQATAPADFAAA